ncbi:MAG TPA: hypothetical protein VMV18_06775 [bacterium]|nr:hypothetical protein [bacterium]
MWKKLGDVVVERCGVRREAVNECLRRQRLGEPGRLGELLVRTGVLPERQLVRALAVQFGIPIALELARHDVPAVLLHAVPAGFAARCLVFPVSVTRTPTGGELILAMADPSDIGVLSDVERFTGCTLFPVIAPADEIRRAIARHYGLVRGVFKRDEGVVLIEELEADDSEFGVIPLEYESAARTTEIG